MKVRIKFAKQGVMKFIGHLDIMRYFQKAIRRAGIPIVYTEGFSPHMVMSFAQPLGVGLTSNAEYMDIEIREGLTSAEIVKRLNQVMADGMRVISCRQVPQEKSSKAMSLVAAADYTVVFRDGYEPEPGWEAKLLEFYQQESIVVLKKTKKSEKEVDIKPQIYRLSVQNGSIFLCVSTGSAGNLKPELVIEAFARYLGFPLKPFALQISREEVYADNHVSLEALGEEIIGK